MLPRSNVDESTRAGRWTLAKTRTEHQAVSLIVAANMDSIASTSTGAGGGLQVM